MQFFHHLVQHYGALGVGCVILLESMGLPLPGESMMIGAALYAATTHHISIVTIVAVASLGAIIGDNIGFGIGRALGPRLLARYGAKIGLDERRVKLGRHLFEVHGGLVVFFGRFIVVLRTFAALLAGANGMMWGRFLLWNAAGGIAWCSLYGFGAYLLGDVVKHIEGPVGIVLAVLGGIGLVVAIVFIKKNEQRLTEKAERDAGLR